MENETYIGDGVFASFDGFQIWLRTVREGGDAIIALEPKTLLALVKYWDDLEVLREP